MTSTLYPALSARPIHCTFSPAALRHNYQRVKQLCPNALAFAVVKADAYGHGQTWVTHVLRDADGFALLEIGNAMALRRAGLQQPILLLEGVFAPAELPLVTEYNLSIVLHSQVQLAWLESFLGQSQPAKNAIPLFIKLNTGMNRLGFTASELPQVLARLAALGQDDLTLMTHFADADGERGITEPLAAFQAMRVAASVAGANIMAVTLSNSAAILRFPDLENTWVRPGIMLYGGSPFAYQANGTQTAAALDLQPVMSLQSAIIGVQTLAPGQRLGYGGTFVADKPCRVGIVACGYADGYPRHAPTGTPLAVAGVATQTLGRVSMDMLACDLSHIPAADIGAPVTLWGAGKGGTVDADAVAAAAGTISYELFCALAPRVPRYYPAGA